MTRAQALCRCGHNNVVHEHYRAGSDCGICGPRWCATFRPIPTPERTPLMADHAASDPTTGTPNQTMKTVGWSPKALFAAVAAVVVPFLLQGFTALVELLAANPALFDGLPAPVKFVIATIVTGLGVLLAARKASPGTVIEGTSSNRT